VTSAFDLSEPAVQAELSRLGASFGRPFFLCDETGSTNDDARRAAADGAPHGAAFFAESQTRGRGRGNHHWFSPPGMNLHGSVLLRTGDSPYFESSRLPAITLAYGVAVAATARAFLDADIRLKWPNDVLVGGRKLAGILVETTFRGDRPSALIVGVGLNVHETQFPPALEDRATSFALSGAPGCDRSRMAARLLLEIERAHLLYGQRGLGAFAGALEALDGLRGRDVALPESSGEPPRRGVAEGVDDEGRLRVRLPDGDVAFITSGVVELLD